MKKKNQSDVKSKSRDRNNGSSSKSTGKGFLGTKPLDTNYVECKIPVKACKVNTEHLKEYVKNCKPYSFFMTLSFARSLNIHECCDYTDILFHKLNNKIFGKGYCKKSDYIEGFAFVEDHKSEVSRNDIHLHILTKHNGRYDDFNFVQHESIFREVAGKVVDARKRRIFDNKCIDIQEVRDDGAIEYCFKQIWDENLSRVKFIGKDGLSDSLL